MKETDRAQAHRFAVNTLARYRAKKVVKEELRALGKRPHSISSRALHSLADEYLTQHRAELIAEAEEIINTWPGFREFRNDRAGNGVARRTTVSKTS